MARGSILPSSSQMKPFSLGLPCLLVSSAFCWHCWAPAHLSLVLNWRGWQTQGWCQSNCSMRLKGLDRCVCVCCSSACDENTALWPQVVKTRLSLYIVTFSIICNSIHGERMSKKSRRQLWLSRLPLSTVRLVNPKQGNILGTYVWIPKSKTLLGTPYWYWRNKISSGFPHKCLPS